MRLEQAKMVPSRIRISGLLLLAQRVEGFHQSGLRVARLDRGSQWTLRRRAEPSSLVSGSSSSINQGREDAVYEQPELYDLAFSYRDFDAEVINTSPIIVKYLMDTRVPPSFESMQPPGIR